jgi:simple sugar transport system substrate-binding protein
MARKWILVMLLVFVVLAVVPVFAADQFVFGMVLVGPKNDHGWSQANYEAGQYVEQKVSGTKMIIFESLNTADNPQATLHDVVSQMVDQGAKLIITTSDAFEEDTTKVAADPAFKDIVFINTSGDDAYTGEAPSNEGDIMGQMEWGKMIAGCAAALTTKTGSIAYLGPLINFETRRLASSVYLGARHCYEKYAGGDPAKLKFTVTWIGFWFNIPGVTLDPTAETNTFYDNGADVVISGIDTTEAIVVAGQRHKEGQSVYAIPYDFKGACDEAPDICLGVPYFNWGPAYAKTVKAVMDGSWKQSWDWNGPDWKDINDPDTSAVGWVSGPGLSDANTKNLDAFITEASAYGSDSKNEGTFFLWQGPLKYQDGTEIAKEGEALPGIAKLGTKPSVWYLDQLLEGMTGASTTKQ